MDRHVGLLGQGVEHRGERLVAIGGPHLHAQPLLDRDLCLRAAGPALGGQTRAVFRQILPVLRLGKLDWSDERGAGPLRILRDVEKPRLLAPLDGFLCVDPPNHPALRKQLPDDRVVGGQLRRLLGDRLGFREPPLVDEHVVFLDQHRQPFVHFDPLRAFPVDLGFDRGILLVEGDLCPAFAGRLLHVATRPFDAAVQLAAGIGGDVLAGHCGGDGLEDGKGFGGRTLGHPLRLELLGGDFGGELRDHEIWWSGGRVGFAVRRSFRGGRLFGRRRIRP